jgi:ABC-type polysaccharide/polyol phosphate transport system ATPase subunit
MRDNPNNAKIYVRKKLGAQNSVLVMNAIELKNVFLDYHLSTDDLFSFKNAFLNFFIKAKIPTSKYYRALDNVSLAIAEGDKVGIIGLNGAGKSTLLRVISGIFHPNKGRVILKGQVSPLLDFTTGFEPNLTGIDNIKIRLMFLGISKKNCAAYIDEIIEFAELGEFIYQPMRNYSSGMFLRLAFATSTAIKPEILVADEVIGTGDSQFAAKAKKRLHDFLSNDSTLVLSSHDMELVSNFCSRIIWLHHGKIIADGPSASVVKDYKKNSHKLSRDA